jgi:hypothetical protein
LLDLLAEPQELLLLPGLHEQRDQFGHPEEPHLPSLSAGGKAEGDRRQHFTKIITRAGHKPWPRLFHNLRASCATDWVERYPNHVVAKWLGHSPMIAATHYLQTRERHFEDVVTGGGQGTTGQPKKSVHICVQSEAAESSNDSHESKQIRGKHVIVRNDANRCEPNKTALVGGEGLEPPTPSV